MRITHHYGLEINRSLRLRCMVENYVSSDHLLIWCVGVCSCVGGAFCVYIAGFCRVLAMAFLCNVYLLVPKVCFYGICKVYGWHNFQV